MKFILATKQNMTQIFDEEGRAHPVTVLSTSPSVVTQIKTKERDGYTAVQVGYGETKKLNKAEKGHVKDLGNFRFLKEFRVPEADAGSYKVGDTVDLTVFEEGDKVRVSGVSKGKGFQGVVKRHGFAGGRRSHGQKHSEREPGSIGSTGPQRVFKGVKMGGRMGGERVTVRGLKVVKVIPEENQLYVKGAIPGRRGTLIEVVQ
ncbi:50S ribosomal protein L3 [bacterium]|nr:50S ribosomal protein L3 [bacterium]|tara:strand:+ start:5080 stop:5688 length:609 start_codon:yes stop_codon:yes gene_type:complete